MRRAFISLCAVLASAGSAIAQTCDDAEMRLALVFSDRGAAAQAFNGGEFTLMTRDRQWYWAASYLVAQTTRMNSLMQNPAASDPAFLSREARVYGALDDAEPCLRADAAHVLAMVDLPDDTTRADLRAQTEPYE